MEAGSEGEKNVTPAAAAAAAAAVSKSARKKLLKRERQAARKAERRVAEKERRRACLEKRRLEWGERLAAAPEEERERLVEERRGARRERVERRTEERAARAERLRRAVDNGPKIILDLEFGNLMTTSEIQSLLHQIMYCYAVNGRCACPAHLWLTGCTGEIQTQLEKLPGFDKWIIQKESQSYIEALNDNRENLVYLTADAETTIDNLDPRKAYIIGGLVDRNRWKGVTLQKAKDQGITSARLPIGNYLKMSSSQVLTVNQVMEILLKFLETKDWKKAFFQVIPQRKRGTDEELAIAEDGAIGDADDARSRVKEASLNGEGFPPKKQRLEDFHAEQSEDLVQIPLVSEDQQENTGVQKGQVEAK